MAKGYNATEYMYSTARLRSLEVKIANREQLLRLIDAPSVDAAISVLSEFGFSPIYTDDDGRFSCDETLMSVLKEGYAVVGEMNCAAGVRFLQYRYDCNNIKSVIKCRVLGISSDSMLLPFGSVETEALYDAFEKKDYSVFPKNLATAIPVAEEAFVATANPQKIDFTIDKATFADMLHSVDEGGIALAKKLVRTNIDLVNLMMTLRIIRMRLGTSAQAIFDEAYISGGAVEKKLFEVAIKGGEEKLVDSLSYGEYSALAQAIAAGTSSGELERMADDILMGIIKTAKFIPFGAEIAIGYICGLECEVKNIRMILAAKATGMSAESVRKGLRECYV